jgi:hypothetical protein
VRLAGYAEVLEALPGRPAVESRSARARDTAVLAGAVAAWIGVLLLGTSITTAVVVGLVAGVGTAMGLAAAWSRRTGRMRIAELAGALGEIDGAILAPERVEILDRDRHALLGRAQRSGRLDEGGVATLGQIEVHLDDLLIRLLEDDLEPDASHLVQASITRYLPDTLEPFLALTGAITGNRSDRLGQPDSRS